MNPPASSAPADPATLWRIWFDGAAHPNPGRIGLGAVLLGPAGQRVDFCGLAPDHGCNDEAELLAVAKALELARDAGARHLLVHGDSDFAVRHLRGEAHTDVARLAPLIERTQRALADFASVQLQWVPRHRNPDADRLSRAALGLPDKPALRPVARRRRRH